SQPAFDPPHPAERRQLTVMFCDLVGSTALSARLDPEDLREAIGAYHRTISETVRRFDGFVAKYMGDGVLVYFGYPRAHEDDAERAVRAGLDVVAAIERLATPAGKLKLRIGIATGLVVVGDLLGQGASNEQAVIGETPNLAARLQTLARPGTIVVPNSTRSLLGNLFKLRDLGRHALKGINQPVQAWAVEGISAFESRFELMHAAQLSGFVGRAEEIGLLMNRWNLAQSGEGQVVLLSGEPGIGKSRIVSELRARLEKEHVASLRFQCSPYYVNSAFYPIIDNFERALKFGRDEAPEAKLDKVEALIVRDYGLPRENVRFIASILSIPLEERYGTVTMTPQKFKDETLRALVDTVEATARKQPSVMLFEDAHWADPSSLEALDLLVDRVARIPLLVVLTHRPEFQSRWSHYSHVTALTLTKLTRAQSSALVLKLAGGKTFPADLLEHILSKTDGVPLFIEELTKSILESAWLNEAGDHYTYAGKAHALAIPVTLRDSLMSRLDRFMLVKEVAQIGAAIGHSFSYEMIKAVAPQAEADLDQALSQFTASGLAFRRGTPPEAVYSFKHALVRDAAYESLLKSRRQELHDKIASVIEERYPAAGETEPELLAHHYTEARRLEKAIPLWHKAGQLALKRMALAEAINHLERGLDLIAGFPPSAERDHLELDLRTTLGTAWIAFRGWPAQEVSDTLHPALALASALGRKDPLLRIFWGLRTNAVNQGRLAESLGWVKQMLAAAETYDDPGLLIMGHASAVSSYFYLGELVAAREHADQVLSLYSERHHGHLVDVLNQDPKTFALGFAASSTWMLGYPDQAIQLSNAADTHARKGGHPLDLGWALTTGAYIFDLLREPEEALKRALEAERLGRENSLTVLWSILAPGYGGRALIRKGQVAEGMSALKSRSEAWEKVGGKVNNNTVKSTLAEGLAQIGDLDGALCLIDEVVEQVEQLGWEECYYYAETLRIKGWVLSLKGDLNGAEHSYMASLDWARRQHAKSWELRTAMSYARLMPGQGRTREAYDLLSPIYAWFTEGFGTKDLIDARALLEELAGLRANTRAPLPSGWPAPGNGVLERDGLRRNRRKA
ncbi:MAG: AAA family ATPase, partial [Acetobacteraceae bacterium]|nr:AAA family ATPase [Acetobacteraceae bacterium]